jgi:DNA-nicking Smr family endonuclease
MEGVTPLKTQPTTDSKAPGSQRRKPETFTGAASRDNLAPISKDVLLSANIAHSGSHHKDGIQKKILQKLKRGRFPVRDQLDLHHMNVATGRKALLDFIEEARRRSYECVRIIHGKGRHSASGPRLRAMSRKVLQEHSQVLAFTSCKPVDGGDGATDVLLKRT